MGAGRQHSIDDRFLEGNIEPVRGGAADTGDVGQQRVRVDDFDGTARMLVHGARYSLVHALPSLTSRSAAMTPVAAPASRILSQPSCVIRPLSGIAGKIVSMPD